MTQPKPSPIRVKSLRFACSVEIPTKGFTENVVAGEKNRTSYQLTYEPWIRHHRIVVTAPGVARCIMVPESVVVAWEPAD